MQISPGSEHRFVPLDQAMDWVKLGWIPLPSLDGTHHGQLFDPHGLDLRLPAPHSRATAAGNALGRYSGPPQPE